LIFAADPILCKFFTANLKLTPPRVDPEFTLKIWSPIVTGGKTRRFSGAIFGQSRFAPKLIRARCGSEGFVK
jgi:hypothetical protein